MARKENWIEVYPLGIQALKKAYFIQKLLSNNRTISRLVKKGCGEDKVLKGDWESEETVINFFKSKNFPIRIISEEHGQIDFVENPKYLAVLDGFDGSSGLAVNSRARGGTMLAIAEGLDPDYDEFIFGGMTDFSTNSIIYAIKNQGAYLIENLEENEIEKKIAPIKRKRFGKETKIHLDDKQFYPNYKEGITAGMDDVSECVKKHFSDKLKRKFELSGLVSSSAMCLDLILGDVDVVCGVIAKGVFEPPAEYRILKEIRGTAYGFVDKKWEEIGNKKWSQYGRPMSPLLMVANQEIGKEFIKFLNS